MNRLPNFLFWCVLFIITSQAATLSLMDEVITVLEKGYVNPLGRDMTTWMREARSRFESTCPSTTPCSLAVAERLVAASLEQIGDPHLAFISYAAPDYLGQGELLGASNRFRYGFRARADHALVITYVQPDTPAAEANLRAGDIIRSVDGEGAVPSTLLRNLLLFEKRRKVAKLDVQTRGSSARTVTLSTVIADSWKPSLKMLSNDTALLALPDMRNYGTIDVLTHELLASATKSGVSKLVIDLRFNRGGSPFGTISIAGAFLGTAGRKYTDKQGMIVTFQYDNGKQIRTSSSEPGKTETQELKNAVRWLGPVVVLVSDESLSAAENLASLLKEGKRAIIIGQHTAGGLGGTMATVALSTGSALSYTNTITTTLTGQRLPAKVTPDVPMNFDLRALEQGRDTMLERALKELQSAK